jgi:hypothetical protein
MEYMNVAQMPSGMKQQFEGEATAAKWIVNKEDLAYAPTSMTQWFARPSYWFPKAGPSGHLFSVQNNQPAFFECLSIDHQRHRKHTVSATHFEDCSNESERCVMWPQLKCFFTN